MHVQHLHERYFERLLSVDPEHIATNSGLRVRNSFVLFPHFRFSYHVSRLSQSYPKVPQTTHSTCSQRSSEQSSTEFVSRNLIYIQLFWQKIGSSFFLHTLNKLNDDDPYDLN